VRGLCAGFVVDESFTVPQHNQHHFGLSTTALAGGVAVSAAVFVGLSTLLCASAAMLSDPWSPEWLLLLLPTIAVADYWSCCIAWVGAGIASGIHSARAAHDSALALSRCCYRTDVCGSVRHDCWSGSVFGWESGHGSVPHCYLASRVGLVTVLSSTCAYRFGRGNGSRVDASA
jgi:hypothetical protein